MTDGCCCFSYCVVDSFVVVVKEGTGSRMGSPRLWSKTVFPSKKQRDYTKSEMVE